MRELTREVNEMSELEPYQERIQADKVRAGDFLDQIDPEPEIRGPRGGRYRWDGRRVQSRVVRVALVIGREEIEIDDSGWIPGRLTGFRIYTASGGTFTLPGNLASLVTAVVRRKS